MLVYSYKIMIVLSILTAMLENMIDFYYTIRKK